MNLELQLLEKLIIKPCEFAISNYEKEVESQEYLACSFRLEKLNIKYRLAKITPTKIGQFVTIWKRNEKGITEPFDILDDIDFYIIATRKENQLGVFIFPRNVLYENKILSDKNRDGKRGIRVYPSWDLTTNKQAQKTQLWQTKYFLDFSQDKQIDLKKAKNLLTLGNELNNEKRTTANKGLAKKGQKC